MQKKSDHFGEKSYLKGTSKKEAFDEDGGRLKLIDM